MKYLFANILLFKTDLSSLTNRKKKIFMPSVEQGKTREKINKYKNVVIQPKAIKHNKIIMLSKEIMLLTLYSFIILFTGNNKYKKKIK